MQVTCPKCSRGIEAADDADLDSIVCPSCESELSQSEFNSETMRFEVSNSPTDPSIRDGSTEAEVNAVQTSATQASSDDEGEADQTRTHQSDSKSIGHFTIVDRLGAGQFGNVYRARDNKLDRDVALKVPKQFLDEQVRTIFLREARAAAQLNHPNIVGIHDVDDSEDSVYLVTEFVQGVDLRQWLQIHQPSPRKVAGIVKKILEGLHHAHEAGVVHRDLKPANIMMDSNDNPRIMDFGLAKREIGEQPITVEGEILGTPAYMSPEQAIGNSYKVDRRADIYTCGVMLFEFLTGEKPFRGDRRILLAKIANNDPPHLRSLKSSIPIDLETITLKCLEKSPANRYQTAQEVIDELDRYLDGKPIVARPISKLARVIRVCGRYPLVTTLAVALVLSLVVGIAGITSQLLRANSEKARAEAYADEVTRQQKETRQYLYVAHMNIIQQVWDVGMLDEVNRLLNQQIPVDDDQDDIRTFEWFMFKRLYDRLAQASSINYKDIANHLEANADGSEVAVVGEKTQLQIWEREGRAPKQTLHDAPTRISNLSFSGDGAYLVAESRRSFVIWKKTKGQYKQLFDHDLIDAYRVQFTSDSQKLVAQAKDKKIVLWDLSQPEKALSELDFDQSIKAFCILNSHAAIAVADVDGNVKLYSIPSGNLISKEKELAKGITQIIQPKGDDRLLFVVCGSAVYKLNIGKAGDFVSQKKFDFGSMPLRYALVSDNGKTIVAVSESQAQIVDARTGSVRGTLKDPSEFSRWMELDSQHGLIVGIGESNNFANLWSSDGSKFGRLKVHNNHVYAIDVTESGEIVSSGRDQLIKFSKPNAAKDYVELGWHHDRRGPSWIWSLAFSHDDRFLASCADDRKVKVWNVDQRKLEFEMKDHSESVQFVLFSPDDKILASASRDGTIRLTDMETRKVVAVLEKHTSHVNTISFTQDGKKLVSVGHDGRLIIWDLSSNQPIYEYQDDDDRTQLWAVIYDPTEKGIYFGGTNRKLQYLSLETEPKVSWELDLNFDLTSLVFSPDGETLSATASNGVIYLVDHASQTLTDTFTGHSADAMSTAFTPDMTTLVSGCHDGNLRFWNLATKERTIAFQAHDKHIHCVRFSNDGNVLASGAWDGSVRLWLRD